MVCVPELFNWIGNYVVTLVYILNFLAGFVKYNTLPKNQPILFITFV